MSLNRLIWYSAVIGGCSAFLGWMVSELLRGESWGALDGIMIAGFVGGAIGAGQNLVSGMANGQWKQQIKRIVPGFLMGGLLGIGGILVGGALYNFGLPRALAWMIIGASVGAVEGLYERSPAKLRNGLIGGAVGGLIGGFLFDPIAALIPARNGMISRAIGFTILGMSIGIMIGLVKIAFRQAWLTVLDGYRPGRQLILSEAQTVLGRAEYAAMPFMAPGDSELEMVHARIIRQPDGRFVLEDNQTRLGTAVNNVRVNGRVLLDDGAVIRLGRNSICFNERQQRAGASGIEPSPTATAAGAMPPPIPAATPAPPPAPKLPMPVAAPAPAPRPSAPVAAPSPVAAPAPRPAPVSAGSKTLPNSAASTPAADGSPCCRGCGRPVPRGQTFCIVCDR